MRKIITIGAALALVALVAASAAPARAQGRSSTRS
jgi:hypothetical protein